MLHHPGSSLRFPTKEGSRARSPTIPHRAHLGTAGGPAARKGEEPSAGLPPSPHPRQGGLREAGAGLGLRLRLREDSRREMLGDHPAPQAGRVDPGRSGRRLAGDGARSLRPDGRSGALRVGRGLLHHQGALRRRKGGQRSPVDRGKGGTKRSVAVDGRGIPLGTLSAPANRHDSPLLVPTLETVRTPGLLVEGSTIHLDRGYDSEATRVRLLERGLVAKISERGRPAPLNATKRWVVERTNSWYNAHKKLVWCTERRGRVVDFWVALSDVVIIVRRLVREGWSRYRWEGRPSRRP